MDQASPARLLNPWLSMWLRPQATTRDLVARNAGTSALILAATGSASGWVTDPPPRAHWLGVLVLALAVAPLIGIAQLYIGGAMTAWTGRWLGGHASQRDIRTAMGWGHLPLATALPLLLAALLVFKDDLVRRPVIDGANPEALALTVLTTVLSLWCILLIIRAIGAVQGFSTPRSIANFFLTVLMLGAAALLTRVFLCQPFNSPSTSMAPTLLDGDYYFVSKTSYGLGRYSLPFGAGPTRRVWASEPERGDIVVFRHPGQKGVDYVKRVIGLPGDQIQMKGGEIYINGSVVPKVAVGEFDKGESFDTMRRKIPVFEETLPNGVSYRVLDETPRGPFDETRVFRVGAGHYFVLGDNRDNSTDSRVSPDDYGVGFVPFENLIGRVAWRFYSAGEADQSKGLGQAFDNIRWSRMLSVPR